MISVGERVYVVPRATLFGSDAPHGFFPSGLELLERVYAEGYFAERARVEEDPSLKQVIPYALVVRDQSVFRFRRRGGGEKRLVGRASIGVGGHVNPEDAGDVIQDCLHRELEEELVLPAERRVTLLGLLNDDSTAVGSVHLGVVARVEVGPGEVRVREEEAMEGCFVARESLLAEDRAGFESWSALLIDAADRVIPAPNPA